MLPTWPSPTEQALQQDAETTSFDFDMMHLEAHVQATAQQAKVTAMGGYSFSSKKLNALTRTPCIIREPPNFDEAIILANALVEYNKNLSSTFPLSSQANGEEKEVGTRSLGNAWKRAWQRQRPGCEPVPTPISYPNHHPNVPVRFQSIFQRFLASPKYSGGCSDLKDLKELRKTAGEPKISSLYLRSGSLIRNLPRSKATNTVLERALKQLSDNQKKIASAPENGQSKLTPPKQLEGNENAEQNQEAVEPDHELKHGNAKTNMRNCMVRSHSATSLQPYLPTKYKVVPSVAAGHCHVFVPDQHQKLNRLERELAKRTSLRELVPLGTQSHYLTQPARSISQN